MSLIAYFGYGSLVNTATLSHDVIAYAPARLKGWRRHWQVRPTEEVENPILKDVSLLSVHEDATTTIDGLLVIDRVENLSALDKREHHYERVEIVPGALELIGDFTHRNQSIDQAAIYEAVSRAFVYRGNVSAQTTNRPKLLQSYLDVVLSGFSQVHTAGAMERFVETTDGFSREMIADRDRPIYRRAIKIDNETGLQHDALLRRAGVNW